MEAKSVTIQGRPTSTSTYIDSWHYSTLNKVADLFATLLLAGCLAGAYLSNMHQIGSVAVIIGSSTTLTLPVALCLGGAGILTLYLLIECKRQGHHIPYWMGRAITCTNLTSSGLKRLSYKCNPEEEGFKSIQKLKYKSLTKMGELKDIAFTYLKNFFSTSPKLPTGITVSPTVLNTTPSRASSASSPSTSSPSTSSQGSSSTAPPTASKVDPADSTVPYFPVQVNEKRPLVILVTDSKTSQSQLEAWKNWYHEKKINIITLPTHIESSIDWEDFLTIKIPSLSQAAQKIDLSKIVVHGFGWGCLQVKQLVADYENKKITSDTVTAEEDKGALNTDPILPKTIMIRAIVLEDPFTDPIALVMQKCNNIVPKFLLPHALLAGMGHNAFPEGDILSITQNSSHIPVTTITSGSKSHQKIAEEFYSNMEVTNVEGITHEIVDKRLFGTYKPEKNYKESAQDINIPPEPAHRLALSLFLEAHFVKEGREDAPAPPESEDA